MAQSLTERGAVETVGREYVENATCERDRKSIRDKYQAIAATVEQLYAEIPVPVVRQTEDPYTDYQDMAETVAKEQQLRVYVGHASHPVLSDEQNIKFRAVHDLYGHLRYDVDFTAAGEYQKWNNMKHEFPPKTHMLLFTEVVGQLGAIHYLPDSFEDPRFEQKAVELPRWCIGLMSAAAEA